MNESSFFGFKRRKGNWFCNRPLSPVQDKNITSSDESQNISGPSEEQNTLLEECVFGNSDNNSSDDGVHTFKDPDYCPSSNTDISSEISLSSPQICFTPPSESSNENFEVVGSDLETRTSNQKADSSCNDAKSGDLSAVRPVSPHLMLLDEDDASTNNNYGAAGCDTTNILDKNNPTVENNPPCSRRKKKVFRCFCSEYVQHFPRHIVRNHKSNIEVQKLLALPLHSKERANLLYNLRKRGNYENSSYVTKPVRKGSDATNYLPCIHCLGFYSAKNLWRHRKNCSANPAKGSSAKGSQADAQNFMIRHLKTDPILISEVFPRMRADQISLIAKKDKLICAFAARYLKIHKEKHFVLVASRKMRELARLLIEVKKMKPYIVSLIDILNAKHYDVLVAATKAASKYDFESQHYEAPTLAINMGTMLKQCCDIALVHVLKKSQLFPTVHSANVEVELKTLIQLIEGNWRFDISTQAANDLNLQKWNKVSLVPLAGDLKLLKDYLLKKAASALSILHKNCDEQAYVILLETIYCRLILLNRRRPGELQRLLVNTYKSALLNQNVQAYEEFSEAISETEMVLMNNFKRIVIRGKRGRGVPVLISEDVQSHLDVILKCRDSIFKKPNNYLFANPKSGEPVTGYKVLKKYATLSGAKNPDALTCTRLRKHLATLTQLLNMNENDMEQLASFMGHTLGIHRSSYRLPDDIYQTARISKLLILMEKGEAGQFKGKSLDEINLNLDEDLLAQKVNDVQPHTESLVVDNEISFNDQAVEQFTEQDHNTENNTTVNTTETEKVNKKRLLVPWTDEQKEVVTTYFKAHIKQKRPPKKGECEDLISKHSQLLQNKNWLKIKVFVQNKYKNLKK